MKKVVDAGYYLYLKRSGKFDSMPACWNNLEEPQRREVLKNYLNLGYVKLDDHPKFRATYFATLGDAWVFVELPHFVQPTPENNTLLNYHDGFALKPKNLVKKITRQL